MKMKRIRTRSIRVLAALLFAAAMIVAAVGMIPEKANAGSASDIAVGDFVDIGNDNAAGYTGIPHWRVLDKGDDGSLFLISEYLWQGNGSNNPTAPLRFEATTPTDTGWPGSLAKAWCDDFYDAVLNGTEGLTVKPTTKTDNEYICERNPNAVREFAGERNNYVYDNTVFFISAEELDQYLPATAQRIAYLSDKTTAGSWFLRSRQKGLLYNSYVNSATGEPSFNQANLPYYARPAFWAKFDDSMSFTFAEADGAKTWTPGEDPDDPDPETPEADDVTITNKISCEKFAVRELPWSMDDYENDYVPPIYAVNVDLPCMAAIGEPGLVVSDEADHKYVPAYTLNQFDLSASYDVQSCTSGGDSSCKLVLNDEDGLGVSDIVEYWEEARDWYGMLDSEIPDAEDLYNKLLPLALDADDPASTEAVILWVKGAGTEERVEQGVTDYILVFIIDENAEGTVQHVWGEPEWTWTGSDEDGYTAATAEFTCETQPVHKQSVEAAVSSKTEDGKTVYTAVATLDGKEYTDTKTVEGGTEEEKPDIEHISIISPSSSNQPAAGGTYQWGVYGADDSADFSAVTSDDFGMQVKVGDGEWTDTTDATASFEQDETYDGIITATVPDNEDTQEKQWRFVYTGAESVTCPAITQAAAEAQPEEYTEFTFKVVDDKGNPVEGVCPVLLAYNADDDTPLGEDSDITDGFDETDENGEVVIDLLDFLYELQPDTASDLFPDPVYYMIGIDSQDYTYEPVKISFAIPTYTKAIVNKVNDEPYDGEPVVLTVKATSEEVDRTALEDAIAAAQEDMDNTAVSEDGKDLDEGTEYVDQETADALEQAISDAQAVLDAEDATQNDIDAAVETLNTAKKAFDDAKQTAEGDEPAVDETMFVIKIVDEDGNPIEGVSPLFTAYKTADDSHMEDYDVPGTTEPDWEEDVVTDSKGEVEFDLTEGDSPFFPQTYEDSAPIYYMVSVISDEYTCEAPAKLALKLTAGYDTLVDKVNDQPYDGEPIVLTVKAAAPAQKPAIVDIVIDDQVSYIYFSGETQPASGGVYAWVLDFEGTEDLSDVSSADFEMQRKSGDEDWVSCGCAEAEFINYDGLTFVVADVPDNEDTFAKQWRFVYTGGDSVECPPITQLAAEETTDKTALEDAIAAAQEDLDNTAVSEDGKDLEEGTEYVSQEAADALEQAIADAQAVLEDDDASQDDIDAAVETLNEAKKAFDDAKKTKKQEEQASKPIYRLYNPKTKEHLWTASKNEYNVLAKSHGWKQEGVAWYAPDSGKPVYRLYNPKSHDHHYTSDANEVKILSTKYGWTKDNNGKAVFYSGGKTPIYRLYNKNFKIGSHHLTKSKKEYDTLPKYGWKQEGTAMYAVK